MTEQDSRSVTSAEGEQRVVLLLGTLANDAAFQAGLRSAGVGCEPCSIDELQPSLARALALVLDLADPIAMKVLAVWSAAAEIDPSLEPLRLAAVGNAAQAAALGVAGEHVQLFPRPLQASAVVTWLHMPVPSLRSAPTSPSIPPGPVTPSSPGTDRSSRGSLPEAQDSDIRLEDFPALAGLPGVESILPPNVGSGSAGNAGQLSPEIEALLLSSARKLRDADAPASSQARDQSHIQVPAEVLATLDDLLIPEGSPPPSQRNFGAAQDRSVASRDPRPLGGGPAGSSSVPPRATSIGRGSQERYSDSELPTGIVSQAAFEAGRRSSYEGRARPSATGRGDVEALNSVPPLPPLGPMSDVSQTAALAFEPGSAAAPMASAGDGGDFRTSAPESARETPRDPAGSAAPLAPRTLGPGHAMAQMLARAQPRTNLGPNSMSLAQELVSLHEAAEPGAPPTVYRPGGARPSHTLQPGAGRGPGLGHGPARLTRDPAALDPGQAARLRESVAPQTTLGYAAVLQGAASLPLQRERDPIRLLAQAVQERVSGALLIQSEQDGRARRILLREGDLVNAMSSVPEESLMYFLVERGDVTREIAALRASKIPHSGRHAAAALIANGYLSQDDLWPVLRAHAEWTIAQMLGDTPARGRIEDDPPERLRAEPNVFGGAAGVEIFIEAVRRVLPAELARQRLGGPQAQLTAGPMASLLAESALPSHEIELVRAAVGNTVAQAALADDVATLLYALVALEILASSGSLRPPEVVVAASGEIDPMDAEAVRQRVGARLALVHDADYFQLLGISANATAYDIKRAYLELRRMFEPNRLLTAATVDLHDDVRLIVEVVEEAYQILRDPQRRNRYRRALQATS